MGEPGSDLPSIAEADEPEAFSWIPGALRSPVGEPPRGDHLRTPDLIPPSFECYAKVLHPVFPIETYADDGWTEPTGDRTSWAQVAKECGVTYDAEFSDAAMRTWPSHLWVAHEGSIPPSVVRAFIRVLDRGGETPVYFWWWVVAAMGFLPRREPVTDVLCRGPLGDLPAFLARERRPSPTYWWPSDRAWCVATDWDLCFTMVGGTATTIRRLLAEPEVEGFEVRADSILLRYSKLRPAEG